MNVLYFDCFSGISGDMTLAALLDLGVDQEKFIAELNKLQIEGYDIKISKAKKNAIEGTDVYIDIHEHQHSHHEHHHIHRNLNDIEQIIDNSNLQDNVKELSKKIFMYVAKVEAKIHGTSLDKIHFHEVGAIDSIIDIVGTAICISMLNVDKIISSPLHVGTGFVKCQHGLIPIPAPATLEILRDCSIPFYSKGIESELVTPTGAAIIAGLVEEFASMPEMTAEKIGYGTGKKELEIPNVLRLVLGKMKKKT